MATINTLYNKENTIQGELERLNRNIEGYKQQLNESKMLIRELKSGEVNESLNNVKRELDRLASDCVTKIRLNYKQNQDVMFLSSVVDEVLTVLEKHKFVGSTTDIIIETLKCASYQKWQETKAEAWGKNNK